MIPIAYFAIGVIATFASFGIMSCVMAFFDGWDGKMKSPGKVYQKLFSLGLALKIKQNLPK